jgi:hypothetical protein
VQALMEALESMRWMIDCCRDMLRICNIPADAEADLPNEEIIDTFVWQVNWWLREWAIPRRRHSATSDYAAARRTL